MKKKTHGSVQNPRHNKRSGPPAAGKKSSPSACMICINEDICNWDDYPNSRKFFHVSNSTSYCDQKEGKISLAHWRLYFNEKSVTIETSTESSPVNYYVRYEATVSGKRHTTEVVYMTRPDESYAQTGKRGCTFNLPKGVGRHDVAYVEAMWAHGGQPNYVD
ncbi:hypothetical protein CBS101457_006689 [Exobasidium rhododendri]|nr:hypothetical protein CBS101457_006689 [Exobasidium rhododendri]